MQSGKTVKKSVRRWISAILVLMIVLTSVIPSGLTAVAIDVPEDVNSGAANLSPLAAGDDLQELAGPKLTKISDNNYEMAYQSGNSYALSKSSAGAFVLETDVTIKQGNAATLMFGATTFDATNIGRGTDNTFFGLEFTRNVNNKTVAIKLFQDGTGGLGNNIIKGGTIAATDVDTEKPIPLRLEVTEEKELIIQVAGQTAEYTLLKDFASAYLGGYIGLMTYNSNVVFNNVSLTVISQPSQGNFENNLDGWRVIDGSWVMTDNGIKASNLSTTNKFYMSGIKLEAGETFVYEGDMHLPYEEGARGGGLVFGVTNPDKPGDAWYCMNVDRNQNVTKLFKNVSGAQGFTIQRTLTEKEKTKEDFHFRVELLEGGKMNFYLDGVLVGSNSDPTFAGGYFGVMSYYSNCSFDNVYYYKVSTPKLTDLEIEGVQLSPEFSDSVYEYTAEVDYAMDTLRIKPTADSKYTIAINDQEAENGAYYELPIKVGYNDVNIRITDSTGADVSNIITIKVKRNQDPATAFTEDYRPQFHFSPEFNFMNDPNGLVYDPSNGTWHMFFQHSPNLPSMMNQTWGHAQSTDLVNWVQMPTAMEMDELGRIYSGSAVVDEKNTSGFFTNNKEGESKLVAIFTHSGGNTADYGGQKQSIAYSKDHGLTWTKYEHNPVISNKGNQWGSGFRDPKVFWYEDSSYEHGGIWLMIVAGGRARIFSSENLIDWKHESDLTYADGTPLESECPDMFELPIDGDESNTKWVYFGAGKFFVLGELVKEDGTFKFVSETNRIDISNNVTEMYATQSYYNDGTGQGRRISVSWMRDSTAPATLPDKVWNGVQSLPLETSLRTVNGQVKLCFYPVEEVKQLRSAEPIFSIDEDVTINEGDDNILAGVAGQKYDIEATFTPGTATEFGFKLRQGEGEETIVKFNQVTNQLIVDKSKSGAALNAVKSWDMYKKDDGTVSLRILVDWSVIDVFGNEGDSSLNTLFFPDKESIGMEFFSTGGDVTINSMKIYDMKSMYRDDLPQPGDDPTMLSLTAPEDADVGEEFTVSANVLPTIVENKTVTWTYDEGLTKVSESEDSITLRAETPGEYKIKAVTVAGGLEKEVTVKVIDKNFATNLTGWQTTDGIWKIDENGLLAECGSDNFAMSEISVDGDFTLEADITLEAGRCPGLVFYAQGVNGKTTGAYVFNFDLNMDKFRIFEFPYINGATSDIANRTFEDAGLTPEIGKTYHVVLTVKDNKFSVEFGGVQIFSDVEDTNTTQQYNSGLLGLIVHQSTVRFQNVFVTAESPIAAVVTEIPDIYVVAGDGTTKDELLAQLPQQVTVKFENNLEDTVDVTWNLDNVDLFQADTYVVEGSIEGTEITAKANIIVTAAPVLVETEPERLEVTAEAGSQPADVFEKLPKEIQGIYADEERVALILTGWDESKIDFAKAGVYDTTGTLALAEDNTPVELTIPIQVTITGNGQADEGDGDIPGSNVGQVGGSDWDWPEGSGNTTGNNAGGSDGTGKLPAQTGDASAIPAAMAVLAISAAAIYVLRRRKK